MIFRLILLSWICWSFSYSDFVAAKSVCSQKDSQKAERIVSTAKSWKQSYQLFQYYAYCDDGAVSEGFSESMSLLLAENWRNIYQLEEIIKSDVLFGKFIVKHIDETVPIERLAKIISHSQKLCSKNLEKLCHDIEKAAFEAIRDAE